MTIFSDKKSKYDEIVDIILDEYGLVSHHIYSYNFYIEKTLPSILSSKHFIKTDNITIYITNIYHYNEYDKDKYIFPYDCILKNLTYKMNIYVDIKYYVFDDDNPKYINNMYLFSIPLMVRSKYCILNTVKNPKSKHCITDVGGYFIIDGKKKIILNIENFDYNNTFIFFKNKNETIVMCSSINTTPITNNFEYKMYIHKQNNEYYFYNSIFKKINIWYLLYFLNFDEYNNFNDEFTKSLKLLYQNYIDKYLNNKNDIITKMGNNIINIFNVKNIKTIEETENLIIFKINETVLPHLGISIINNNKKIEYIIYMMQMCNVEYSTNIEKGKNNLQNKLVKPSGNILSIYIKKYVNDIRKLIIKNIYINNNINIQKILQFEFKKVNNLLINKLFKDTSTIKSAIENNIQQLNTFNYLSTISHLRRIRNENINIKNILKQRFLNSSQYGFFCPNETPEGENIGLINHFSILAFLSKYQDPFVIIDIIEKIDIVTKEKETGSKNVFLNGCIIGYCKDIIKLRNKLRSYRFKNYFNWCVGLAIDDLNNLLIRTYPNRVVRFVLNKNIPLNYDLTNKQIKDLLYDEIIECIDSFENKNIITKEITPYSINGIILMSIPFISSNPSPRNTYGCGMLKQSIGYDGFNSNILYKQSNYMSLFNTIPLVDNFLCKKYLYSNLLPVGQNVIVAIMVYTGCNQEDSIILKKSFIDNGGMSTLIFKNINFIENIYNKLYPNSKYTYLDDNGIIKKNSFIVKNTVLVNYINIETQKEDQILSEDDFAIVDKISILTDNKKNKNVKITLKIFKLLQNGDKIASKHSQKGTIGKILDKIDMPYTEDGITPDIILNPHAIPSRMTIGHLKEMICSLFAAHNMTFINSNYFFNEESNFNILSFINLLKSKYNIDPNVTMYNGYTGKKIKTKILMGPIYYLRLKHIASLKLYSRDYDGPIQQLFKQPTEGKVNSGGIKLGSMEFNVLISYSLNNLLYEKYLLNSDNFIVDYCLSCNIIGCYNHNNIKSVKLNNCTKILLNYLMSLGIYIKIFC